jgi:heme/copper-type cytochrome/quinol oxidase subunit 2
VPVRPSRLPAALAGLGLAAVLTGCAGTDEPVPAGSSASSSPSTSASVVPSASATLGQRLEVTVTGGQVTGDTGRVPVPAGEHVTLVVTSDAADELHVHGYDLGADLAPGTPATVEFDATIPGVFEVELHDAGTLLLSLQVS